MTVVMALTVPVATVAVAEPVEPGGAGFLGGSEGRWTGRLPTTARP